ncbi:hypothetical protein [Parvularcula oceani]|uniref:hypothetical protein n=1 Tax=Parvularcula oceani TaxID=1247963 RepID=UPI0012DD2635|nr:hypothetical protein [Parvularcula oceani]
MIIGVPLIVLWTSTIIDAVYVFGEVDVQAVRALLVSSGAALLGASAIVSSLVLFAMQVNVERMPFGLFRRFGADARLLWAFAATFVLSLAVATSSLLVSPAAAPIVLAVALTAATVVLFLFLYTYRRALALISPHQQLAFIRRDVAREARRWGRRASRAALVMEANDQELPKLRRQGTDPARLAFFKLNPEWSGTAERGVSYAAVLARRYAGQGDHEVSREALRLIIEINFAYVRARGRTFFPQNPFLPTPLATEGFVNLSLEQLRQDARAALDAGDEELVRQILGALHGLVHTYLEIDYGDEMATRTHAHLAAAYLTGEVERVLLKAMPDVLMEGLRLMGRSAGALLVVEGPNAITTLASKITSISAAAVVKPDHRPATLEGMEQLARLTMQLLRTPHHDVKHAGQRLRDNVAFVATTMMKLVPEAPPAREHDDYLAPYYSMTSPTALHAQVVELANAAIAARADDEQARKILRNFAQWSDGMYRTYKELLLLALERESGLAFHLVSGIKSMTGVLVALSNASACSDHVRAELRRNARWLISVLSWVPRSEGTVHRVEAFQMTKTLFEATLEAQRRGAADVASAAREILLKWTVEGGANGQGWAILPRGTCALAVLVVADDDAEPEEMLACLRAALAEVSNLEPDVRDRTARELREEAVNPGQQHWSSSIGREAREVDRDALRALLMKAADVISPA